MSPIHKWHYCSSFDIKFIFYFDSSSKNKFFEKKLKGEFFRKASFPKSRRIMHCFLFLKIISVMASSIFVLQRLIQSKENTADIIAIFTWRIYQLLYCFIQSVNDLHHVIVLPMTGHGS
jgi:hypothetical protein